jgi:cytochrome P450
VVTEALRVTTPTPVMLRSVAARGRVGRVRVGPGDRVIIATLSCTRKYGSFDPDRAPAPALGRLWFGAGQHICLGMPLAMAEIDRVFAAVLSVPGLRVVDRRVARRVLIPGYAQLVLKR